MIDFLPDYSLIALSSWTPLFPKQFGHRKIAVAVMIFNSDGIEVNVRL